MLTTNNDIPTYALLLIEGFSKILTEMKSISQNLTTTVEALESKIMVCENTSLNLQADNARLNKEVDLLKIQVDNMEQRNRNINLLVHGVPEEVGENTTEKCCKLINEKVVNLECADIAISHRYGPFRLKKTRPIIVRFSTEAKKLEVYRNKKRLKGSRIVVTENLTSLRLSLYKKAMTVLGSNNVWTSEGKIFTKINNKLTEIDHNYKLD